MIEILLFIVITLCFISFMKKSLECSNDWFKKCKISFVNEYVNSVIKELSKICNESYNYHKKYPDSTKSNCWLLEYDNLDLNISNRDFSRLIQLVNFASKKGDMLFLMLTSPGGLIIDFAEIYAYLKELKDTKNIKIIVSISKICTSGGYLLASLADEIYSTELALIGSIGVTTNTLNVSQLLEKLGINYMSINSGELKNPLTPFHKPSETQIEHIKNKIDHEFSTFLNILKLTRGDKIKNIDKIKSGATFNGIQAVELGLVDQISNSANLANKYVQTHNMFRIYMDENLKIKNLWNCVLGYFGY